MNGYEEAFGIDKQISKLLEEYPIEQNAMEWWRLVRTVKSGMELIEEKSKDVLSRQTRELASLNSKMDSDEYLASKKNRVIDETK